jgi:hypothetical protein
MIDGKVIITTHINFALFAANVLFSMPLHVSSAAIKFDVAESLKAAFGGAAALYFRVQRQAVRG